MKKVIIITDKVSKKRIEFGMDRIQRELQDAGYATERVELLERLEDYRQYSGDKIYIGERGTDRSRRRKVFIWKPVRAG